MGQAVDGRGWGVMLGVVFGAVCASGLVPLRAQLSTTPLPAPGKTNSRPSRPVAKADGGHRVPAGFTVSIYTGPGIVRWHPVTGSPSPDDERAPRTN